MKLKLLLILLVLIQTASAGSVSSVEGLISQMGLDVFGNPILIGIVLFIVLCAWLAIGRYGFEVSLLSIYTYFMIAADGGLLPNWTLVIILIIAGVFTYLAAHKLMNRGG